MRRSRPELPNLLEDETLIKIGKKYNKSAAQVALRWSLQRGCAPIPKAITEDKICENANVINLKIFVVYIIYFNRFS